MPIMIQISELSLSDEEKRPIFQNLSFRLNRGEWASIGGGPDPHKRLLLDLLCGHIRPDRGQILVDERNILRVGSEKLRLLKRRLGLVIRSERCYKRRSLSHYIQFKLRALDVSPDDLEKRARYALDLVGLSEQADQVPEDLGPVDLKLFQLALALSHDPVLLLLDEPLTEIGKDREKERFLDVLEQIHLRKRLTTLMTLGSKDRVPDRFPITRHELLGGVITRKGDLKASTNTPAATSAVHASEGAYE